MKGWLGFGLVVAIILIGTWFLRTKESKLADPGGEVVPQEKPYDKYTFENIAKRGGISSKIEIGREIKQEASYGSYFFYYTSDGKLISGQMNLPAQAGLPNLSRQMGVIVMARGYVEKSDYQTGIGTRNAAAVYAKNGYITLAPDFSGYGESDPEDTNALGARLAKPVEVLDLLASLSTLPQADLSHVYLWGHSNGGQIMLSVAEIVGMRADLPAQADLQGVTLKGLTLWAPVSKPFPYNILYYTDEADDQGKWLREQVAKFEMEYDVYKYSLDKYFDKINLPIQLHQGSEDEAVPKLWSDTLTKKWEELGLKYTYYVYPGTDHNMKPGWDTVVTRDLTFFAGL